MVHGGGANGGVDGACALADKVGALLGNNLAVLHGIGSCNDMGVSLNDQIYAVSLNRVVKPGSVLGSAFSVIYRLVYHEDGKLRVLICLQVVDQPLTLCLQNIHVVGAVGAGVKHDKMHATVVVGVNGVLGIIYLLVQVFVGNATGDRAVQRILTVVWMVEMQGEIVVVVVRPSVVVAYRREMRDGGTVVT